MASTLLGSSTVTDVLVTEDDTAGREIGPLDKVHQIFDRHFIDVLGVVNEVTQGIAHLAQVVRRDIGGHAHGNARWSR